MSRSHIRTLLPRNRTEAIIIFLIALVGAAFYHPRGWNQNARLAAAAAFVEPGTPYTGTFRIDGLFNTPRFNTGDWARSEGRLYSNKAPGTTLLAVVPYFLLYHGERLAGLDPEEISLTQINAFIVNLCISVFWNVVAALALLRRLPQLGLQSRHGAMLVTAMYAFATLVLPYGSSLWGHSTAAAFLTLATLSLFDGSLRGSALAGWWFGLAVLTEYFAALSIGLGGAFLLLDTRLDQLRHVRRFVLGSAPPLGALLIYQKICFGSFLTTAAGASNPAMLDPTKFAGQFGLPSWNTLLQLYFSSSRGLLPHMPILVMAGVGLVWWCWTGRRRFAAFAVANIAGYSLAVSAMTTTWHGGVTTSSRYLIVALPFFCLLAPNLDLVPLRGAFVVLLAISAANMFMVAATSTMLTGASPIYGVAYSQFWRGEVAFNPLLTAAGVEGVVPALIIALTFAAGLTWVVRTGVRALQTQVQKGVERFSKRAVLTSLVVAVVWVVWQSRSPSLAMLSAAAAIGGVAVGESLPVAGAAVLLLLAYWVPLPYSMLWTAALGGLLIRDHAQSGWNYPPRWRPALVLWALTIAGGWPLIALRELDFESPSLLARYAVTNTASGSTPGAVIAMIANTAAAHLLGLLWFDWLFRRFATSGHAEAQRWIVYPLAVSAIAGCVFALLQNAANGFAVIAACWSAGLLAVGAGTRLRFAGLVGALLCWSVVMMSGSRAAVLAAGVATAVTAMLHWRGFPGLRLAGANSVAGVAIPATSIGSHLLVGVGIGTSAATGWWRQWLTELGILGIAGIFVWTASLIAFLLRARPDSRRRLPAAAACGALSGMAVLSMSAVPGQGLLIAVTAGTFAFWLLNLVDRDAAAPVGVHRLGWIGVSVLLVAFLAATVIAARGELRVPHRAAQGGWPYTYGMYPAPGAGGTFVTERHGVSVVTIEGRSMIFTIRAEHPDIRERPVEARVDVDGQAVLRARLHTNDPLVRQVDAGGNRRAVVETRVDRTWRDTTRAADPREIGLSISWRFADD